MIRIAIRMCCTFRSHDSNRKTPKRPKHIDPLVVILKDKGGLSMCSVSATRTEALEGSFWKATILISGLCISIRATVSHRAQKARRAQKLICTKSEVLPVKKGVQNRTFCAKSMQKKKCGLRTFWCSFWNWRTPHFLRWLFLGLLGSVARLEIHNHRDLMGSVSVAPTPTTCLKSTALHLQFVRQYAPQLYRRTCLASKLRRKGNPAIHLPFVLQYTSHLYGSTPPICTTVLLEKYWGLGSPERFWFNFMRSVLLLARFKKSKVASKQWATHFYAKKSALHTGLRPP